MPVWKAEKSRHVLPAHRRDGHMRMPVSGERREIPADKRNRKADMAVMVMSAFFVGSIPSAEGLPQSAGLPRLQRRSAAGALGRTPFPGRLKGHMPLSAGTHPCMSCFRKRRTGGHRPPESTAYQPSARTFRDGEEDPSLRRRVRHRQQGQWPLSHSFFRSRFPGYRRPGPRPHRRRDRPWRNGGYGAA